MYLQYRVGEINRALTAAVNMKSNKMAVKHLATLIGKGLMGDGAGGGGGVV
jgi:hypothetical protein